MKINNFEKTVLTLDTKEFIEILKETDDFRSKDDKMGNFTGVCLDYCSEKDRLNIVALDGYKLYVREMTNKTVANKKEDFELILSKQAIDKIKKIKSSGTIEIKKAKNSEKHYIVFDNAIIDNAFIDGDYSNYKSMLDETDYNYNATYSKKEKDDIIKYFEKCKNFTNKQPLVSSEIENGVNKLLFRDESTTIIKELKSSVKDRFKIAYNADFMLSALKLFKNSNIEVSMIKPIGGIIIKDSQITTFVLPVRLAK